MTSYTILIKFNDGTNKCVNSFYTKGEAIDQFQSIVKEYINKFDRNEDDYCQMSGLIDSITYDKDFSCNKDNEFFPIGFEIIEQEIDDSLFDWKDPKETPVKGSLFIAKMKNGQYVYGEIITKTGWIASTYFRTSEKESPYWDNIKNKIETWFYVKK